MASVGTWIAKDMAHPKLEVQIEVVSPDEVYQRRNELTERERTSFEEWAVMRSDERFDTLLAVHDTLLRLLSHPGWIPGAVIVTPPKRLDIHITVDLSDIDRLRHQYDHASEEELYGTLVRMSATGHYRLQGPLTTDSDGRYTPGQEARDADDTAGSDQAGAG